MAKEKELLLSYLVTHSDNVGGYAHIKASLGNLFQMRYFALFYVKHGWYNSFCIPDVI